MIISMTFQMVGSAVHVQDQLLCMEPNKMYFSQACNQVQVGPSINDSANYSTSTKCMETFSFSRKQGETEAMSACPFLYSSQSTI